MMKLDSKYMICGRVVTYCEQLNVGVKLVAEIGLLKTQKVFLEDIIKKEKCKVIFNDKRSKDRTTAWIYKYEYVGLLINQAFIEKGSQTTILDIWIAGKLFGYADCEIEKYLKKHGYV